MSHEDGTVEAIDADFVDWTNVADMSNISGVTPASIRGYDGAVDVRYQTVGAGT